MTTLDKITLDQLILKMKAVENIKDKLYSLGQKVENKCPKLIKNLSKSGNNFKYLEWTAYEYVLKDIDPQHHFWISHADQYRVEVTISWFGKEYKGSYGVKQLKIIKSTGLPFKSLSEQVVDDGMRCYAKLASRVTGFMNHFWLEGDNE